MPSESLSLNTSRGATSAHVARPENEPDAAVLLIQEWWGINDHIREVADRLAKESYLAVAPDLYRGKVTTNSEEASKLMHALEIEDGLETIRAALAETKSKYGITRVGIMGFCMGGTFALRAACEILELSAAAPFYGDIPEEQVLQKLSTPTLFIAGKRDAWINAEKVNGLKAVAEKHNLPLEVVSYDADHAFFNNTRPEVYDADAAADAWQRVLSHFRKNLTQAASGSA